MALPIWFVIDVLSVLICVLTLLLMLVLTDDRPPLSCFTFTASVSAVPAATLCRPTAEVAPLPPNVT